MIEDLVRDRHSLRALKRVRCIPLLEEIVEYLETRGHRASTVRVYTLAAGHFLVWVWGRRGTRIQVTQTDIEAFIEHHLPRCRCRFVGPRVRNSVRAALNHLSVILSKRELYACPAQKLPQAIELELKAFESYLRETCGLSASTRLYRRRYVGDFLVSVFGTGQVTSSELTPDHVIHFMRSRAVHYRPESAQVVASSIRSYLRFCRLLGQCDPGLVAAVPTIACYRQSQVPKTLDEDQLSQLLESFDRSTPTGKRDYAMTRCLIDLGLRASEVAGLSLDDVRWRDETLRIRHAKSRRDDELPLPGSVARAISAYLRHGRPRTAERSVFVRHIPPVGSAIGASVVRAAVRNGASRAGLAKQVGGTHILRHTAASRMLAHGVRLKEIADVLHHRCVDTTLIYTKIDLPRLDAVAMPWPEKPS